MFTVTVATCSTSTYFLLNVVFLYSYKVAKPGRNWKIFETFWNVFTKGSLEKKGLKERQIRYDQQKQINYITMKADLEREREREEEPPLCSSPSLTRLIWLSAQLNKIQFCGGRQLARELFVNIIIIKITDARQYIRLSYFSARKTDS